MNSSKVSISPDHENSQVESNMLEKAASPLSSPNNQEDGKPLINTKKIFIGPAKHPISLEGVQMDNNTYASDSAAELISSAADEESPNVEIQNEKELHQENSSSFPNQLSFTLSYSLLSQLRQMARMEGVNIEDIVVELVAEGITKRAFEDAGRPAPSHLMTRTGYMPPDASHHLQPTLSHHVAQTNSGNVRNPQTRRFNHGAGQNNHPNAAYSNGHKPFNNRYPNKSRSHPLQNLSTHNQRLDVDKDRVLLGSKRQKDQSRS